MKRTTLLIPAMALATMLSGPAIADGDRQDRHSHGALAASLDSGDEIGLFSFCFDFAGFSIKYNCK